MSLVQKLEQLGQVSSLKQYQSVKQMILANNQDEDLLAKVSDQGKELVCLIAPEDED